MTSQARRSSNAHVNLLCWKVNSKLNFTKSYSFHKNFNELTRSWRWHSSPRFNMSALNENDGRQRRASSPRSRRIRRFFRRANLPISNRTSISFILWNQTHKNRYCNLVINYDSVYGLTVKLHKRHGYTFLHDYKQQLVELRSQW